MPARIPSVTRNHIRRVEILGVVLSFECPNATLLEEALKTIRSFFPFETKSLRAAKSNHHFLFCKRAGLFVLESEFGKQSLGDDLLRFLRHLRSLVRIIVAANPPDLLFVHAGVVAVDGKGIIIPGDSHSGKTSLVKELVKRGAVYFSDEYAVINSSGMVLPFPKPLSVRGIDGPELQTDLEVASLGGTVGSEPVRIGHVVLTRYRKGARWKPRSAPFGDGLLKVIPHVIGFAKRAEFSLPNLQKALKNAKFLESERGDVKAFSKNFLETLDK